MAKQNYTMERIIIKLREAEVLCAKENPSAKQGGVSGSAGKPIIAGGKIRHNERRRYQTAAGAEKKNVRLKKLMADLRGDNAILAA